MCLMKLTQAWIFIFPSDQNKYVWRSLWNARCIQQFKKSENVKNENLEIRDKI